MPDAPSPPPRHPCTRGHNPYPHEEELSVYAEWLGEAAATLAALDKADAPDERAERSWRCFVAGLESDWSVPRCENQHLCPRCRSRWANDHRSRLLLGRALHMETTAAQVRASGRPWREVFVTLTLPELKTPEHDVLLLIRGWTRMLRALRRSLGGRTSVGRRSLSALAYVRLVEIAPGVERGWQPHLHAWLYSPLGVSRRDQERLRQLWASAIRATGYVRVDLRRSWPRLALYLFPGRNSTKGVLGLWEAAPIAARVAALCRRAHIVQFNAGFPKPKRRRKASRSHTSSRIVSARRFVRDGLETYEIVFAPDRRGAGSARKPVRIAGPSGRRSASGAESRTITVRLGNVATTARRKRRHA